MKTNLLLLRGLLALLLLGNGCSQLPPHRDPFLGPNWPQPGLKEELSPGSLAHLRQGIAAHIAWSASPADAAYEFLYGQSDSSERPKKDDLIIKTTSVSPSEAIVIIADFNVHDDSVHAICHRLTMRFENGGWLPVEHRTVWRGRGRENEWGSTPTL